MNQSKEDTTTRYEDILQDSELNPKELTLLRHLWEVLECPVCYEVPIPPIPTCFKGHHVCKKCRGQIQSCPLCEGYFMYGRDFSSEHLVRKIHLPCKYRIMGCNFLCVYQKKEFHESMCAFQPYHCPLETCTRLLISKETYKHFLEKHTDNVLSGTVSNGTYYFPFDFDFSLEPSGVVLINLPEWECLRLR